MSLYHNCPIIAASLSSWAVRSGAPCTSVSLLFSGLQFVFRHQLWCQTFCCYLFIYFTCATVQTSGDTAFSSSVIAALASFFLFCFFFFLKHHHSGGRATVKCALSDFHLRHITHLLSSSLFSTALSSRYTTRMSLYREIEVWRYSDCR